MKTIIAYFIVLLMPFKLVAQPGTPDKSFGENGQVVTKLDDANVTVCKGLVQPDNKIIAVGEYESALPPYTGFVAIRYMPDGLIDSGFGDGGKIIISDPSQDLIPSSACLQNDGKILIAGYGVVGLFPPIYTGVIVRLNSNGSIDSSFGTDGIIQTTTGNNGTTYNSITIQPDGKIVCIGTANTRFVCRLLKNGSSDNSFGANGYIFFSNLNIFYTCIIQSDGKIIVGGGYRGGALVPEKFLLRRFQPDGEPDLSFDSAGTTVTQVGNYDSYIYDLALQSDGKIVALGPTDNYTATATARYNVDGSFDNTFAKDGISHDYFPGIFGRAASILIQSDDKILLGGGAYINEKSDYGLERLTASGLIDSSFGVNGETTTDFADYGSGIVSIGLQTSGKIVAVGGSSNIGIYNVSLARYNNDDAGKKQIIITKIKKWLQHHNGFTWDNNSSINSYVVQRGEDGIHWKAVSGEQRAVSNSSVNYYEDASPLSGDNYYRLQTTSVNGSINYSNVIAVTVDENAIRISPNPAQNVLHVAGLSSTQKSKLTVVDITGNTKLQTVANASSYNLNIASLNAGNYLLKIEMNAAIVTKQFIKQ